MNARPDLDAVCRRDPARDLEPLGPVGDLGGLDAAAVPVADLDLEVGPGPSSFAERRLTTRSGASITIAERDGVEHIEVRDAGARLVFELDASTGRTVVSIPTGDLTIAAAGKVEIRGREVQLRGVDRVALEASTGDRRASLVLGAALAELVASRVETVADRLFERARSVFRRVDDLHQLRAGRSRTVVEAGYHVKSGHTSLESTDETRIDGKTIHLG